MNRRHVHVSWYGGWPACSWFVAGIGLVEETCIGNVKAGSLWFC